MPFTPDPFPAEDDEAVLNALADELFAAAKSARKALNEANGEIQVTLKELARRRKAGDGRV